ncbi:GntR family transcriptional regulator [Bradyrhizobium ontarionense]|uniref:GntR family transcriptional regulator n=1 Tax=Bradyrhizobium ontarionense TaxID=2898149 RepID=A0ABY3RDB8_9BRAD|nr:GntR family transcriptional regulator [Bradyrhizobium sp. A19]UFZ05078.1 GntR family transcriptional regulator [Bradyrhizobium sp. A19]
MSETRYAQVARDLAEGIANGRFPVGSVLPTEFELCDHYGASRHTVRAAIKELQDLGLVSRKKKLGTRVEASTPAQGGYRPSLTSVADLVQFGAAHTRVVQDMADLVADRPLAKMLGCAVGRRWLRISSLRLDGDEGSAPIGWTDVYVDAAYASLRDSVRTTPDVLISDLIEARFGRRAAEIRQDIEPVLIPDDLAQPLRVDRGTAGLRIIRHYLDSAGACFETSVSIHPAGRFMMSMRLKRERE